MESNIQKEDLLALVKSKIYTIRGQKVMLDFDLAHMYDVETKRLNEAVRRNKKRFEGDDFMFRLTKDEIAQVALRSQIVTFEIPLESGDLEDSTREVVSKVTDMTFFSCFMKQSPDFPKPGLCHVPDYLYLWT